MRVLTIICTALLFSSQATIGMDQTDDKIKAQEWCDAIKNNNQNKIDELIAGGFLNCKDGQGHTPLHIAIIYGNNELIARLLAINDTKINTKTISGYTPIDLLAENNNLDGVKLFLNHPRLDKKASSYALFGAVIWGHHEMLKLLLTIPGIDVNARRRNGTTPLHYSEAGGDLVMTNLLLNADGIDANILDHQRRSTLSYAIEDNRWITNQSMREARANNLDMIKLLLAAKAIDVNAPNCKGYTALYYAIRKNNPEILSLLLAHPEIDIMRPDKSKNTALDWSKDMPQMKELVIQALKK